LLNSGNEGVREAAKQLNFTLGWSATNGAVDKFVYENAYGTFINDAEMLKRLLELNPHSFHFIVGTLLEVNGRG
jgi:magnesium chelatase subunit H